MAEKKLKFEVSAELKNVIGKDLITNDFVAVFELVKNSFDANATMVKVVFELCGRAEDCIYIIDNGKGMSSDDIKNKWLKVAFSAKKQGSEDSGTARSYAGSKGIGRFSCDRLGAELLMSSSKEGEQSSNQLRVNWGDFEGKPFERFESIHVYYTSQDHGLELPVGVEGRLSHGTILKISRLRNAQFWTRDNLIRLKRALQKLLDPFSDSLDNRNLEVICKREQDKDAAFLESDRKVNGLVRNAVFKTFFRNSTVLEVEADSEFITTTLVDRGAKIYTIRESYLDEDSLIRACKISMKVAFLNTSARAQFKKQMGVEAVSYGSVFLVNNGFRVYPIGEDGDDFWHLNRRKQQGYNRFLGTREVLGCVHVQDDKGVFVEATNREGLADTDAAKDLREFFIRSLKKLEAYVTRITWQDKIGLQDLTPDRLKEETNKLRIIELVKEMATRSSIDVLYYNPEIVSILDAKSKQSSKSLQMLSVIAERLNDCSLIESIRLAEKEIERSNQEKEQLRIKAQQEQSARLRAEAESEKNAKEAQKKGKALDEEKKRSKMLVISSSRDKDVLECFLHEIVTELYTMRGNLEYVFTEYSEVLKANSGLQSSLVEVFTSLQTAQSLAQFSVVGNFRFEDQEVVGDLIEFANTYVDKLIKGYLSSQLGIRVRSHLSRLEIKFKPVNLSVVFENLISNAKKADAKNLWIDIGKDDLSAIIEVSDDGSGFKPDVDADRIFEKGYSRTNGSGLGLYFCREFLHEIGGDMECEGQNNHGGVTFKIRIPLK